MSTKLAKMEQKAAEDTTVHIQTPGLWLPEKNVVFEEIEGEKFLLNNGEIVSFYPNGTNSDYIPLPQDKINWKLCIKPSNKPIDKKKLWKAIKRFLYKSVELPDDRLYTVLTAWIFATWINEVWAVVPYVFFVGVKASGKTRGLEALQMLAFRGKMSISSTAPALFRSIEEFNCVPFLDEAEVYNQDEKGDVVACLNAGYKRVSAIVERCQGESGGNQTISTFHIFGFKGIAGTESLRATLESRSIIINMAKNTRPLDVILNDKAALAIRTNLLKWRFGVLLSGKYQPNGKQPLDSSVIDEFDAFDEYDEFDEKTKPVLELPTEFQAMRNSRVIELFLPLYEVSEDEDRKIIIDYAKTVATNQRTEENTSLESEILLAILACSDKVESGGLANGYIENAYNEGKSPKEQLYGKTLTGKIAALGLERCRVGNKRGFVWNTKLLHKLCDRFGFDAEKYFTESPSPLMNSSKSYNSSDSSNSSKPTQMEHSKQPFNLNQMVSCTPLEAIDRKFNQLCPICKETRDTLWKIQFFDKSTVDVCSACGSQALEHLQKKEERNYEL